MRATRSASRYSGNQQFESPTGAVRIIVHHKRPVTSYLAQQQRRGDRESTPPDMQIILLFSMKFLTILSRARLQLPKQQFKNLSLKFGKRSALNDPCGIGVKINKSNFVVINIALCHTQKSNTFGTNLTHARLAVYFVPSFSFVITNFEFPSCGKYAQYTQMKVRSFSYSPWVIHSDRKHHLFYKLPAHHHIPMISPFHPHKT